MVAAVLGSFGFKLEVQHKYISNYSTAPNTTTSLTTELGFEVLLNLYKRYCSYPSKYCQLP